MKLVRFKNILTGVSSALFVLGANVSVVLAQKPTTEPAPAGAVNIGIGIGQNKIENLTIGIIIKWFLQILIIAAALVFFIWLVLGGIKWIISGGNPEKVEEARNQITAALIGLIIVFAAWAVARLIKELFGIDLFQLQNILQTGT